MCLDSAVQRRSLSREMRAKNGLLLETEELAAYLFTSGFGHFMRTLLS